MSHWVYIIFSTKLDRYYVGESVDVETRLAWHNQHIFDKSYTSSASDWVIKWKLECESIVQARKIEAFIKRMKSKKFIERLMNEDASWLILRFK